MNSLQGANVLVVGAGVVGSAVALDLARNGAEVTLADRRSGPPNASAVAAGMLAPVMESLLDPMSAGHLPLYRQARDLWPLFVRGLDLPVFRCGAALFAQSAEVRAGYIADLRGQGVQVDELQGPELRRRAPGLSPPFGPALFTAEDWRVDAPRALQALQDAAGGMGVRSRRAELVFGEGGARRLSDGAPIRADAVVLATGLPLRQSEFELPELSVLSPIKGQLVRFAGAGPPPGPIIRTPLGYAVPSADGLVVGATMEVGLDDSEPGEAAATDFTELGRQLFPSLAECTATPMAAVRAATPDGLPLVGASSQPGVFLALGARRNGWLLAPLIAEVLRTALAHGAKDPRFDPLRFGPTAG